VKGPIAKKLLVKHVLLKGLHLLKGTAKVGEKWNNLVPVFKKEPQIAEFMLGVSTEMSGENLQKQFYSILDEKETWLESGNKSGKEGDLDEDNVALRQIMMDLEDQETDKKKKEELKKDLEKKESGVTSGQVQDEISKKAGLSRSKRKASEVSGLTSSSSDSSPADAHAFLDDYIFRG